MTPLQQLEYEYRNGCGAEICEQSQRRVFYRGDCPCDIVFVGEAPGESEDCIGVPFIGPAGKLLDQIVENGLIGYNLRTAFMNLTCCIPRDLGGRKSGRPDALDIECCSERLSKQLKLFRPCLIVAVGKLAKDYLTPGFKHSISREPVPKIDIEHPSYILRQNIAMRDIIVRRCVVILANGVRDYLCQATTNKDENQDGKGVVISLSPAVEELMD